MSLEMGTKVSVDDKIFDVHVEKRQKTRQEAARQVYDEFKRDKHEKIEALARRGTESTIKVLCTS